MSKLEKSLPSIKLSKAEVERAEKFLIQRSQDKGKPVGLEDSPLAALQALALYTHFLAESRRGSTDLAFNGTNAELLGRCHAVLASGYNPRRAWPCSRAAMQAAWDELCADFGAETT